MGVSATFEYDAAEHYRALRAITRLTPFRWVSLLCFLILPVGFTALTAFTAHATGHDVGQALVAIAPYILLLYFWGAVIPWSQRRRAKRLPKLDPSVRGVQERRVDAEGYHSRGNGVALDIPWHAVKRVVETEQVFLFFYNWQCAYYLPKRSIEAGGLDRVRELARAALGDRARVGVA